MRYGKKKQIGKLVVIHTYGSGVYKKEGEGAGRGEGEREIEREGEREDPHKCICTPQSASDSVILFGCIRKSQQRQSNGNKHRHRSGLDKAAGTRLEYQRSANDALG